MDERRGLQGVVAPPSGVRVYYPTIDIVRFGCALLVVAFHLGFSSWFNPNSGGADLIRSRYEVWPGTIFWWASVGVDIFFVISGFVIASSANGASLFGFVRSRIERLYPAAWICATLSLVVLALYGSAGPRTLAYGYAGSMLLSPIGPWIEGQYWTLGVEIGFYACIALLLAFRLFRWLPALAYALIAAGALSMLLLSLERLGLTHRNPMAGLTHGPMAVIPIHYGAYFGLGILMWLRREGLLTRYGYAFVTIAVAAGLLTTGARGIFRAAEYVDRLPWITPTAPLAAIIWAAACIAIAFGRPVVTVHGQPLPRTLAMVRTLGLATYPLYLVHFALGIVIIRPIVAVGLPSWLAVMLAIAVLTVVSVVIATRIEPVVRQLPRYAARRALDLKLVPRWAQLPTDPLPVHGPAYPVAGPGSEPLPMPVGLVN